MGNRRMGLGRLEALLEAVDRDLDLTNSTLTAPSISGAAALSLSSEAKAGGASVAKTALSVTIPLSICTTGSSAGHVSLADGTTVGQVKIISFKTKVDDLVITPANLALGTQITADAVGAICILIWDGANWSVTDNTGMVVS